MEIKNVNLDRKPVDSEYIRSRQDFQQILKAYKKTINPVWKQPLFYGVIGFASIAAVISFSLIDLNQEDAIKTTSQKTGFADQIIKEEDQISEKDQELFKKSVVSVEGNNIGKPKLNGIAQSAHLSIAKAEIAVSSGSDVKVENPSVYEPKVKKQGLPSIAGAFDGTLSLTQLCNKDGIESNSQVRVESFTIQYFAGFNDNVMHVKGNRIPVEVCTAIEKSGGDQLVYITEILGQGLEGDVKLPSLSFWIEVNS